MAIQTFEPVGPFTHLWMPALALESGADPALLRGQTTNRLMAGEFLALDADGKLVVSGRNSGTVGSAPAFAVWDEPGRGDMITSTKMTVLKAGMYEASTKMLARTAAGGDLASAGGGAAAFNIGARLVVDSVHSPEATGPAGTEFRGLREQQAGEDTAFVVGFVTRVFSDKIHFLWSPHYYRIA